MTLAPGAYLTVLASGLADTEVKKNYVHTSFKLSAAGEVLALFDKDGVLQDKYNIQPVPHGVSVGRTDGQDSLFYFAQPTPGAANTSPLRGITATPVASVSGGSYGTAQTLTLTCDTEGAVIRYTTDGTTPTQSSSAYSGAIDISKTSMVRMKAFNDGYLDSTVRTETYLIGAQHSLPVLSIVTDPDNLWDEETGIYAKGADAEEEYPYIGANFFEEWEKPASFEVFNESGEQVFAQNVAIRIAGGYSRGREQKSFAVFARSAYGPNSLKYAFFDNRPFDEYESLLLRQGGQDQNIAKIKEIVALSLVEGQGFNYINQAFKPYVLYLNGEYWGVYFMMEKRNKDFIAQHEGIEYEDNINILKATSIILKGTNEGYKELLNYIETHDMSKEESFEYVAARLDTDSFMDMMINQIWVANTDYANLQFYQILPDGKWKQVYYDFCWTFGSSSFPNGEHPTISMRMDNLKAGSTVLNGLLKYKPWRDKFIERFAWALKEIYPPKRVIATIDSVAEMIRSEMPAERAKFGGSVEGWEKQLENMKVFANKRGANVVQQLKSTFSLSQEQTNMLEDAIKYSE
jgi:hypothetical protein